MKFITYKHYDYLLLLVDGNNIIWDSANLHAAKNIFGTIRDINKWIPQQNQEVITLFTWNE